MKTFLIFLLLLFSIVSAASPFRIQQELLEKGLAQPQNQYYLNNYNDSNIFTNVIFLLDSIVRGGNINVGDIDIEAESVSNTLCGGNFSLLQGNRYFIDENFELQLVKVYFGRHASIEVFYKGGHVSTAYASPTFRKIFYAEDRNAILASTLVSVSPSVVDLNADLTYERGFESVTISERIDCTTGNLTVNVKQNNRPLNNARVSLANADGSACGRKIDTKTTDGNGNVIFGRSFNGNYYVLVSGNGISGRKEIKIGPGGLSCDSKPPLILTVDSSCNAGEVAINTEVESSNNSVSNAKVEVFDENCASLNKSATTTGNGLAIIMGLSEGTYCVKASKDSYTSAQTIVSQICPLPININTELICKNEKPALVVTTSSKTSPVKDTTIALSKKINDQCSSNSIEITNEQGEATFSDLSEGSYCITAARDGYETSESSVDVLASNVNQCKPPEDVKPEISIDILCPSRDLIINLKNAPSDGTVAITPTFRSFSNLLSSFSCLSAERIEEKVSDHLVISAQRLKENCRYIIDITANNKNLVSTNLLYASSCPLSDMYVSARADCNNNQLLVSTGVDNAKVEVYDGKCENLVATEVTDNSGIAKLALANGNYCIKVSKEDYNPAQIDVDFFCELPSLDISATADCKEGKIVISSDVISEGKPVDANVQITKFESGACTSETSEFTKGKYCVIANKNGYNAAQTFVDVSEGLINQCKPPEPEPGDLSVDAELVCDGTNVLLKATVDSEGKKIENANIALKENSCSDATIKSERTNAAGIVTFSNIEPNTYCVVASKDGYKTADRLIPYIAYNAVANQCNVEPPQINMQTRGDCNNLAVAAFDNNGNRIDGATIEVYDGTCTNSTGKNAITDNGIATITGLEGKNYCIKGSKSGYKEGKTVIELSCPLPSLDISTQPNCKDNKIIIETNVTSSGKKVDDASIIITEFKDGKCSAEAASEFTKGKYCISASKVGYNSDDEIVDVSEGLINQCKQSELKIKVDNDCKDDKSLTNIIITDENNKPVKADITIRKRTGSVCSDIVAIEKTNDKFSRSLPLGSYCISASASSYKDVDYVYEVNEAFINQCKPPEEIKPEISTDILCPSRDLIINLKNAPSDGKVAITPTFRSFSNLFSLFSCLSAERIEEKTNNQILIPAQKLKENCWYIIDIISNNKNFASTSLLYAPSCQLPDLNVTTRSDCNNNQLLVSTGVDNAKVEVYDGKCENLVATEVTDNSGIAKLALANGNYCIKVSKDGYKTKQISADMFCAMPSLDISATADCKEGKIVISSGVTSEAKPVDANIQLTKFESGACTSETSEFTKGKYCVIANKDGYNAAQTFVDVSEQLANQCKPPEPIYLSVDAELVCDSNNILLKATVNSDEEEIENATVDLKANSCSDATIYSAKTNTVGITTFSNIEANTYCVVANKEGYKTVNRLIPSGLYNAIAKQCKVAEPPQINVQTRGDCNNLTIAALDENGKGVNNASVNILNAKCDELITSNITDSDGIATVSGLNASGYCVRVTKEGYETKESTVNVSCPLEELNVNTTSSCDKEKFSIETLVTSKGKKIKDAEIEIFDADCSRSKNKKSVTNDFGNVTIRELDQGAYCIKVTKPGYHTSQRLVNKTCEGPTIKPPVIETPSIIIETKTSCDNRGFSVTAKSSDSESLSNANIWLYDSACKNNIASATTDGDGITTFYGLENNNYCIKASKSGFNNAQKDITLICAGASTVVKSDLVISSEILCPDQDLKININANGAAVSLRGEGACKAVLSKNSQNNFVIFSKEQLTKGCNYKIRATHLDYNSAELDVAYDIGALVCAKPSIKIEPNVLCPSELSVKVLVDNAPKQNANVKVMNKYTLLLGEFSPPSIVCNAKTDSAGQAKCTNLKQSEYMIEAEVVLSSRTKYTTTETASLTNCAKLSDGSAASPIEPSDIYDILANESGNVGEQIIATTYKNGEPMPFANVSIISPNGKELMTTTDGSGSVVVPLEFDGDYRLSLIKEPGLVVKSKTVKAVLNLGDIDVKETKAGFSLSPLHVLFIPLFLIVALLIYGYYRNRKEGEFYRV